MSRVVLLRIVWCLLTAPFMLSGCAARIAPLPSTGILAPAADSAQAVSSLAQRNAKIVTLKALYRVEISSGSTHDLFRYAVTLDRPDRVRLEILPINMAYSLLVLTADANAIYVVDHSNDRVVQGADVRAIMGRELRLPLVSRELAALIVGGVPFDLSDRAVSLLSDQRNKEGSALIAISPDRTFRLQIDPKTGRPIRTQVVDPEGERVLLEVRYIGFQEAGATDGLPDLIEVEVPGDSVIARLELRSGVINGAIKESAFEGID